MTTKQALLSLLEEQKGSYLSGEEIAERLSVSRTAVWKAVKSLQNEGYEIEAATGRGYCLSVRSDMLSAEGIRRYLAKAQKGLTLTVLPEVGSTNTALREQAAAGAAEGCVLLAQQQTAGRGRMGRSFHSPAQTGVYLSILLRPAALSAMQAIRLTTMAAVAGCEAIEEISDQKAEIKWVNDIFIGGKKVSGILTEASLDLESGRPEYVVLGIGFNLYPPEEGFPEELQQIAAPIFTEQQQDGKNRLAAAFLNRFFGYYRQSDPTEYVEKYRARSLAIGKEIRVLSAEGERRAWALDVDEDCHLLVRYADGTEERLSSGEIRIRL